MSTDLETFLADDSLEVPVKTGAHPEGKIYSIPSPNWKNGLLFSRMANLATRVHLGGDITEADLVDLGLPEGSEEDLWKLVLGPAWEELTEDDISHVRLERVGRYAFVYFAMGPEAAEALVSGNSGALNRQDRRAALRESQRSTAQGSRGTSPARKSGKKARKSSGKRS